MQRDFAAGNDVETFARRKRERAAGAGGAHCGELASEVQSEREQTEGESEAVEHRGKSQ